MINPNQSPLDQYTLLHFAAGVAMRRTGVSLGSAIALSLLWEYVIEPAWKRYDPELFPVPSQDKPINSFLDTVAVGAGWLAAKRR
jgi:hypothetical protein